VHWPAVIHEGGRITGFVGHFIDVMATIVDISSATYPKSYNGRAIPYYEGQSLLPLFRGYDSVRADPLFWEWRTGRAARSGNWKIVSSNSDKIGGSGDWELYDMSVDKTETHNLADEMLHVIKQLDLLYKDWWADLPMNSAGG
jgi:arylsulfatase